MGDHYALHWEPEMLQDLGSAFKIFATEVVAFSIQQALAHTIMGALLAGLAWPLALTKLGYLVDNPWHNGLDRARLAGLILADSLMNRNLGARPVTLVGYSLGARVIFYCLLELARVNAHGLVDNVALFGTPVSASQSQWEACISVVAGRFVNGYSKNDWLLGFLFRASTAGLSNVAGLRPLKSTGDKERVLNIDCTDILKGHLSYRTCMPKLLKRAGFLVTSEELPERVKASEEEENNSDQVVLDLSGAKVCICISMKLHVTYLHMHYRNWSISNHPPKPIDTHLCLPYHLAGLPYNILHQKHNALHTRYRCTNALIASSHQRPRCLLNKAPHHWMTSIQQLLHSTLIPSWPISWQRQRLLLNRQENIVRFQWDVHRFHWSHHQRKTTMMTTTDAIHGPFHSIILDLNDRQAL